MEKEAVIFTSILRYRPLKGGPASGLKRAVHSGFLWGVGDSV